MYSQSFNPITQLRLSYYSLEKAVVENPVPELIDTILKFQFYEEMEDLTNLAKSKLQLIFSDVPYKNGYKFLNNYKYFPNGLCVSISNLNFMILEPYEIEDSNVSQKKNRNTRNYTLIRTRLSLFCQRQLLIKNKKSFIRAGSKDSLTVQEAMKKFEEYNKLTDEEKKLLPNENRLLNRINNSLDTIRNFNINRYHGEYSFKALTEDQLAAIEKTYEDYKVFKDNKEFSIPDQSRTAILDLIRKLSETASIDSNLQLTDFTIPDRYGTQFDMATFIEKGYPKIVAFGERDKTIKQILIKEGVLPKA